MDGFDLDTSFFSGPAAATPAFSSFSLPDLDLGRFAAPSGLGDWASASGLTGMADPLDAVSKFASDPLNRPGAGGGSFGFKDFSNLARDVAPILGVGTSLAQIPLSLAALSQAGRGTKALESAVGTEARAAAPGIAASERLTPAGTEALLTGTLPPELQAHVDQQVSQAEQALLQQLVSQGIDPATARAMVQTQLQELRNRLTLQAAEALIGGGGATGTQAIEAAALGGRLGGAEAGMAGSSLAAANQALTRLTAAG